jgi:hypothetical protein
MTGQQASDCPATWTGSLIQARKPARPMSERLAGPSLLLDVEPFRREMMLDEKSRMA